MIIALAVEENNSDSNLSEVFGRSKCFLFFDTEKDSKEIICNPFKSSFGGAGIQTSQILIEKNCEVLITKSIGTHASSFLKSAGIKVYISTDDNVSDAISSFENSLLSPADETLPAYSKKQERFRKRHHGNDN